MYRFGLFCLLGALALTISSCSGPEVKATADSPRVITVAVAPVITEDLSRGVELAAEFRPYQEVDVHAKIAGFVRQISVDVGDRVSKGQVLAVLEVPELADELNQATAAEKRSELDVERARGDLQRADSAHTFSHVSFERLASVIKMRPNLVAQQEIDQAAARDREAEAQIESAKAALAASQQQVGVARANKEKVQTMLAYTRITAPFTGVITKRFADTGAMVQAGTASQTQAMPLVRLSENGRLRLVLPAPETIVSRIHLGAPVSVRVPSLNRTFRGSIARFSQRLNESTRTMETEVDVPNPQLVLMPGMYAYATLMVDRKEDALAVPIQAVSVAGQKASVLIVNGNKQIEERQVKLGIETPSKVEVLSGLEAGDLVVIGNRSRLRPGQPVNPKLVQGAGNEGGA